MRKLTFEALPGAIAEILERLDRVEQLLNGKTPAKAKVKKQETKSTVDSIDVKEAAKMLSVSIASVYSYVKNKQIPFEKKGGKLVFSRISLETWQQEKNNRKKNSGKKSTAKKSTAKKSTAKKSTAKKRAAEKSTGNNDNIIVSGELITPQEAQKFFNKPLPSIHYIIRTRKLQAVEKKGRAQYYSKDELSKALTGKQKKSDK